jgi:hypothetical protein
METEHLSAVPVVDSPIESMVSIDPQYQVPIMIVVGALSLHADIGWTNGFFLFRSSHRMRLRDCLFVGQAFM